MKIELALRNQKHDSKVSIMPGRLGVATDHSVWLVNITVGCRRMMHTQTSGHHFKTLIIIQILRWEIVSKMRTETRSQCRDDVSQQVWRQEFTHTHTHTHSDVTRPQPDFHQARFSARKVLHDRHGPIRQQWSPFLQPPAGHQPKLQDHGY